LVDSLTDPEKDVRIATAQALGYHGSDAASLLLRLKTRLGDREPDVISECFSGLLACDPREYLSFVGAFLDPRNEPLCEAAALALGRSRLPEALDPLKVCLDKLLAAGLRETVLLAVSMLRLPAAIDFLISQVASASERVALGALTALRIHAHDPRLRQRVAEAVAQQTAPAVRARFERDFPA
jgi:hypothetical protein